MAYRIGHREVSLFDLASRSVVARLPAKLPMGFLPDGRTLVASTTNPVSLAFYDIPTRGLMKTVPLDEPEENSRGTQASPDCSKFYIREGDGSVTIRSIDTARKLFSIRGSWAQTWAAKFSPNGRTFAVSVDKGTIVVWDLKERREIVRLPAHREFVNRLAFSPDGLTLVSEEGRSHAWLWTAPPLAECNPELDAWDTQLPATPQGLELDEPSG